MEPLQISLSPELSQFVEAQIAAGGYKDPSDYISALVAAKKLELARDELESMIEEGVNSPRRPLTPEVFDEIRERMHERIQELNR
jgi:putative addiction module CopG family antidote